MAKIQPVEPIADPIPAPSRIRVPQSEGQIVVFDGGERAIYHVKEGVIEVPQQHVAHVLAGVPGAALVRPESPASNSQPEAPVKEN